jgi:type IV secretion system protein VirB6
MGDIQWQVFAYIVSQVEAPLVSAVADVLNAFLTFVASPLKVALVLYIALTGALIIRGETNEAGAPLLGRILKMSLVVWIITGAGAYQQYVYDFFFTTLPSGLSNALTSSGSINVISANSFDQVWLKAWRAGLEVWRTLRWNDIAEKAVVALFWFVAILSTSFCFAIWLISRVILALYIAIGPLLIPLVLFPATRAVFERWIGSLISCVILQVTTIVLLYIVLAVEQEVVGTVASMGSVDPMVMIQVLFAGIIFFAVSAYVGFQLPSERVNDYETGAGSI